jgi:murein DD-endopeptidase MepM/ murein hydrolase activator NlpD
MRVFSRFLNQLVKLNQLGTPRQVQWLFHTGMLYGTYDKWWADFGIRITEHEGIDITFYKPIDQRIKSLSPRTVVPACLEGKVLNICDDFLGQSLIVEHPDSGHYSDYTIVVVYSHIDLCRGLKVGDRIKETDPIGRISKTDKNPALPPHLHLSCIEVPGHVKADKMNWHLFSDATMVQTIHPLFL